MTTSSLRTLALLFSVLQWPLALAGAMPACPAVPETMRAVRLVGHGGPEQLKLESTAVPTPKAGEVLVRVSAASVNPADWKIRENQASTMALPWIPGGDAAGVVAAAGSDVHGWRCGEAVVAYLDNVPQGSYAEFVAVPAADVARKPAALTFREGAAYPLVAVTAWQAVEAARVAKGDRVLIQGGSGGVGSMALQIAKARGAYVIATASTGNVDYVRSIGADQVVDYTKDELDAVHDADVLIDTVGGETLTNSLSAVRRGGRAVTVTGRLPGEACATAGIACAKAGSNNEGNILGQITKLFAQGKLRINVDSTFPLEQAGAAQERSRTGHPRGKIVLDVRSDAGEKS